MLWKVKMREKEEEEWRKWKVSGWKAMWGKNEAIGKETKKEERNGGERSGWKWLEKIKK